MVAACSTGIPSYVLTHQLCINLPIPNYSLKISPQVLSQSRPYYCCCCFESMSWFLIPICPRLRIAMTHLELTIFVLATCLSSELCFVFLFITSVF